MLRCSTITSRLGSCCSRSELPLVARSRRLLGRGPQPARPLLHTHTPAPLSRAFAGSPCRVRKKCEARNFSLVESVREHYSPARFVQYRLRDDPHHPVQARHIPAGRPGRPVVLVLLGYVLGSECGPHRSFPARAGGRGGPCLRLQSLVFSTDAEAASGNQAAFGVSGLFFFRDCMMS